MPIELSGMALVEDPAVRQVVLKALEENNIELDFCNSDRSGREHLKRQKFDLVVLDSDVCNATDMLHAVRTSPSSSKALVFAITNSPKGFRVASDCGATFALRKPVREDEISGLIRAGYGTMLRERRQYFRCNMVMPVRIGLGGDTAVLASSMNLSRGGMAAQTEFPMQTGASVEITFALPGDGGRIQGLAQVVWADQRGKAGFRFANLAPGMQRALDEWLSAKFYAQVQGEGESLACQPALIPAT